MKTFVVGKWYDSQRDLRTPTHNPAKGISRWRSRNFIVVTYHGSRRAPYDDKLDLGSGFLSYVGHGRTGDQERDHWNRILIEAYRTDDDVEAFLDCGDLFKPKQLMYAGKWKIIRWRRRRENGRMVFRFLMVPSSPELLQDLRDTIMYPPENKQFEKALTRFAAARDRLYTDFAAVLRARDNAAGAVGEYFAIRAFNSSCSGQPLIRCSSSFRDVDAIQAGTSKGFAIKTVTRFPALSSSIWSDELGKRRRAKVARKSARGGGPVALIDRFIIVVLDQRLRPRFIGHMDTPTARLFAKQDHYQGSNKLQVCEALVRHKRMVVLHGNVAALCEG
jgi:hypothetical protein